jgi:hypothetical protein
MLLPLKLHPDSACAAVARIEVDVARPHPGVLLLGYSVEGDIAALKLPPPRVQRRADELWRTTCFEAFLRAGGGEGYHELNFSPSTEWAAYRFSGYRLGMSPAAVRAPRLGTRASATLFVLDAALELDAAPGLPSDAAWRLGLSAVIEDASGHISYWALAHSPGRPDFHAAASFALELL